VNRPAFSIVVCTIDADRIAQCVARYRAAFAPEPVEVVPIHRPLSLAAGYMDGLARSRGRYVVFSHDDAWPISPDFGVRLAAHLAEVDVVGVAGATRAIGGYWAQAGQPDTHGHIVSPNPQTGTPDALVWGAESPRVVGIRILDGCFIAARRAAAQTIGFDATTFDGFHLYDADFALRAHTAGRAVAVAADLTLFHRSQGDFGPTWQHYDRAFRRKHRANLDPGTPNPRRVARLPFATLDAAAAGLDAHRIAALTRTLRARVPPPSIGQSPRGEQHT
jgi:GT2 family glycosyltransferase